MKKQEIFCDNCGLSLGEGLKMPWDFNSCGASECIKAERDYYRDREIEAREEAERDNYERYK